MAHSLIVSDKETTACANCNSSFNLMRRRHHCRRYVPLPTLVIVIFR
jgi:hypothetical protein